MTDINTDKDSIIARAKEEVREERNKAAVGKLKHLYRELADAEEIVASVKRKIAVEEKKVS